MKSEITNRQVTWIAILSAGLIAIGAVIYIYGSKSNAESYMPFLKYSNWTKIRNQLNNLNLDFEKVSNPSKLPNQWFQWGHPSFVLSTDSQQRHSGKYSVRIEPGPYAQPGEFGCVARSIPVSFRGKNVTVKAFIKVKNNDQPIGLLARIDANGKTTAFDNMMQKDIKGTGEWQEYSVTIPLPTESETIYIGAIFKGVGCLWVDDFQVLIDGKDISQVKIKNRNKPQKNVRHDNAMVKQIKSLRKALNGQKQPTADILGFESLSTDKTLPDNWFLWTTNQKYSVTIDNEEKHSGKYSVKIESYHDSKPNVFGCIATGIPAMYKGDSITVRAFMKAKDNDMPIGLLLRIDGKDKVLQFDNMIGKDLKGTEEWTEYSVTLPLPKNAEAIYIGAILVGKGQLWADDFSLSIDGKDISQAKTK